MANVNLQLRVGVAQRDISPAPGTGLAGSVGAHRPAQTFLDPLLAKALVLESDARRLVVLSLDVTMITREYSQAIRDGAAARFGLAPDALLIHATQTHSAPGVGGFLLDEDLPLAPQWDWVRFRDTTFNDMVVERSLEALGAALEDLQAAQLGAGSTEQGTLAFNRRAVGRSGEIFMPTPHRTPPTNHVQLRFLEGPIDPEVGVQAVRSASGKTLCLLLSYTCHPVHLFLETGGIVSADWPGAWAQEMRAHCDDCLPIVINGACGDINPWHPFDASHSPNQAAMGRALAEDAQRVLASLDLSDEAALDLRVRHLKLPLRDAPSDELDAARRLLQEHPEPLFRDETRTQIQHDWMTAAQLLSVHLQYERDGGALDYELQVFRIGNVAWVGLPGEPFASGGLEIKLASPAPFTFIAHCTSHQAGYLPPRGAYARGGHEVNLTYWAKVAPGAWETIAENAIEMLRELWPDDALSR